MVLVLHPNETESKRTALNRARWALLDLMPKACDPHPQDPAWGVGIEAQWNHSCFAYAMGDLAHGRNVFPNLPGFMEWTAAGDMDYYNPTPAEIKNGTEKMKHLVENFGLQPAAGANDKKIGFYLVAVFFGTRYVPWSGGRNFTYHFYRRFCDGTWKHKDGMTAVTNLDSSDNIIANPETADKNYLRTEYTHFVGYYFVPNSGLSADTLLEKYPDPKKKDAVPLCVKPYELARAGR
jgi:hypothetical protein